MRKIKSQFDALRSGRQIAAGGCCCCCCCSCIATIIGFSIGTARHIHAKAKEYNAQSASNPINVVAYTIYASLFFAITTATAVGLLVLFDPKEWYEIVAGVVVGVLLNFSVFVMLCNRINIKIQYPIAIVAGFSVVAFAEFWIWVAILLH